MGRLKPVAGSGIRTPGLNERSGTCQGEKYGLAYLRNHPDMDVASPFQAGSHTITLWYLKEAHAQIGTPTQKHGHASKALTKLTNLQTYQSTKPTHDRKTRQNPTQPLPSIHLNTYTQALGSLKQPETPNGSKSMCQHTSLTTSPPPRMSKPPPTSFGHSPATPPRKTLGA